MICSKAAAKSVVQRLEANVLMKAAALAAGLLLGSAGIASAAADNTRSLRVAFLGFHLINTSLEATTSDENHRIHELDELLREKLDASGRFTVVAIPPNIQREVDAGPEIGNCNGCERDFAKEIDADWVAWGTVQKVSNLILNINLYMEDAQTGKLEFIKSVDIRGNTDESWRRGLDYMLRHYLFRDP